jgi:hypothetical protein
MIPDWVAVATRNALPLVLKPAEERYHKKDILSIHKKYRRKKTIYESSKSMN